MATSRMLVIGSGAREHALAWRLARDPSAPTVMVAPGNAGIARGFRCLDVREHDASGLVAACRAEAIDLAVIGPEAPLALGVADALRAEGISTFGPSAAAARIESSKWFAKRIQLEAGVPTARAESFEALGPARAALPRFGPPWVVKADGLAAGKGVCVTAERMEAEAFLAACLEGGRFGAGGRRVLLEEFLAGEELSLMAVCDGRDAWMLPPARDHKRAHEGDRGPNTGGMGAFAPLEDVDGDMLEQVRRAIVLPVLQALERHDAPFRGVLYAGLMRDRGRLQVLEFNARFGDPETQVVVPLLEGDLGRLLASAADGALDPRAVARGPGAAVGVALVDEGYPTEPRGGTIVGLEELMREGDPWVFAAGIEFQGGAWRVRGGRAATVVAAAPDRDAAAGRVYGAIDRLSGNGWRCRRDIAATRGWHPHAVGSSAAPSLS